MKITATTSTETTIKVSGVPTCWDSREAIEKEIRKICVRAEVDYLRDDPAGGFQITSPGNAPKLHDESFVKAIVENAVAEAKVAEAERVAQHVEFVTGFKWRNIGEVQAACKFQKTLQDIVAREEEHAKKAQRTMSPEEAYFAMFDMPAYYDVWDALFKGGPEHAAKVAQHQDTAVREVFGEFFDLMEDEGRSW